MIYALAHTSINSKGYATLKTLLFNHFTPFYLLAGPSFYFFIKSTTKDNFKFKKVHLIHLIPFFIQCIAIYEYIMFPWTTKMELVNGFYLNPENQSSVQVNIFFNSQTNYLIRFFHITAYLIASIIWLKKFSNFNQIKRLKVITLITSSIVISYNVNVILILINGIYKSLFITVINFIVIFLLFLLILEFIKAPELYINTKKINKSYLNDSIYIKKNNNKTINKEDEKQIALKIEEIKKNEIFFKILIINSGIFRHWLTSQIMS